MVTITVPEWFVYVMAALMLAECVLTALTIHARRKLRRAYEDYLAGYKRLADLIKKDDSDEAGK